MFNFNISAIMAMIAKEYAQMRRDKVTFAMIVGIPLMQLIIFGFAINLNPKNLSAVALVPVQNEVVRSLLQKIEQTGYIKFNYQARNKEDFDKQIRRNKAKMGLIFDAKFTEKLAKGERVQILLAVDASDPTATAFAVSAVSKVVADINRSLIKEPSKNPSISLVVHNQYNPSLETRINIVPGLIGIILTMTLVIFTAITVTKEIERGTMEGLLVMPISPVEIMIGKIVPYIFVGFIQVAIILLAAWLVFGITVAGSFLLLSLCVLIFIIASLAVGYTFSTVAKNQLQAMQMSFMFLLPNILLSGFMFPFEGMPLWARIIGEILPVTHFLRMLRGIILKGLGMADVAYDISALLAFTFVVIVVALVRFRGKLE